jgi:hypothetical protein
MAEQNGKIKLSVEQQIQDMIDKNVQFELYSKEQAKKFLKYNNYYFKLKSYARNYNVNIQTKKYYRNLLGGLYRENPVKSRNYEAVKSSKKWENVGNSYIIPALLLYRYSYI